MLVQAVKMLVEAVQVLGFVSSSILPTIVLFITVQQCNLDMYRNIMYHLSVNKITMKDLLCFIGYLCCEIIY